MVVILVWVWDKVTWILSKISLLELINMIWKWKNGYQKEKFDRIIEKKKRKENLTKEEQSLDSSMTRLYKFINRWVVVHTYIALLFSLFVFYCVNNKCLGIAYIMSIYGLLRVFEIIVKQIRVILFDTIGVNAIQIRNPRRSIILLIHNIVEMIFWFAVTFETMFIAESKLNTATLLEQGFQWREFLKGSTLLLATFGDSYSRINEMVQGSAGLLEVAFWEILIGFIIIVISLARFFSILPGVKMQEE